MDYASEHCGEWSLEMSTLPLDRRWGKTFLRNFYHLKDFFILPATKESEDCREACETFLLKTIRLCARHLWSVAICLRQEHRCSGFELVSGTPQQAVVFVSAGLRISKNSERQRNSLKVIGGATGCRVLQLPWSITQQPKSSSMKLVPSHSCLFLPGRLLLALCLCSEAAGCRND